MEDLRKLMSRQPGDADLEVLDLDLMKMRQSERAPANMAASMSNVVFFDGKLL